MAAGSKSLLGSGCMRPNERGSSTRPSDQREEEKKAVTFLTSLLCEARLGLGQGTLT